MNDDSMFQFRDRPLIDPRTLTISKGDTVLYENVRYIVLEAGMRWLRCTKEAEGGAYSMRKDQVVKIIPEAKGVSGA